MLHAQHGAFAYNKNNNLVAYYELYRIAQQTF
jgi:hypothetical protein